MDREVLLELGCEEIPASWLPGLTTQIGERFGERLVEFRLTAGAPVETYSTPRRLAVRVARVAERQSDFEETVTGPPVSAAFRPDGTPTPAAVGFARKQGVEVDQLTRVETPKGEYVAFLKRLRSKAAVDVLPDVLSATLRDLSFPKLMHWDATLEDGRGELLFGRPVRWILYLYGGRVVPFVVSRTPAAQSSQVHEVRSGAVTYGHRFLATSGRAGRAIKVRSFDDYKARLSENFVVLERAERHNRIARELDVHARRLGGRVLPAARLSTLLQEVPDLVEYPAVVAGTFAPDFLDLPSEVLTVTMIHHQHYFPVVGDEGNLLPAFLAVTNTQTDNAKTIARNAERVLTARLRDARFFWQADRAATLESRLARLDTLQFHQRLGSYRAKADRIEKLARWIARETLQAPDAASHAARAARLAKADLATDMVREFTELQGTMGGIYAREEGAPDAVWRAVYYHYLPAGVDPTDPPTREELGNAAVTWAAVSLADKADTLTGLFGVGEEPTGSRDPFGLRRQAHGVLKVLVDLPELTGLAAPVSLDAVLCEAAAGHGQDGPAAALDGFFRDRLRFLFERRGYAYDEVNACLAAVGPASLPVMTGTVARPTGAVHLVPLDVRRRLEGVRSVRGSEDFRALAVLFKRVKNIAREIGEPPLTTAELRARLTEPAEVALLDGIERRQPEMANAVAAGDYARAFVTAAAFRADVDRFFTEVFVMVDDAALRRVRLSLMVQLRDLILQLADISEIVGDREG